uniref:Uncharacterized protein n=1 Tax=Cucumis melo TaxID=3656 RepID=A0A9I9EBC1_CUCME
MIEKLVQQRSSIARRVRRLDEMMRREPVVRKKEAERRSLASQDNKVRKSLTSRYDKPNRKIHAKVNRSRLGNGKDSCSWWKGIRGAKVLRPSKKSWKSAITPRLKSASRNLVEACRLGPQRGFETPFPSSHQLPNSRAVLSDPFPSAPLNVAPVSGKGSSTALAQQASHFKGKTGWMVRDIGCKTEFTLTSILGLVDRFMLGRSKLVKTNKMRHSEHLVCNDHNPSHRAVCDMKLTYTSQSCKPMRVENFDKLRRLRILGYVCDKTIVRVRLSSKCVMRYIFLVKLIGKKTLVQALTEYMTLKSSTSQEENKIVCFDGPVSKQAELNSIRKNLKELTLCWKWSKKHKKREKKQKEEKGKAKNEKREKEREKEENARKEKVDKEEKKKLKREQEENKRKERETKEKRKKRKQGENRRKQRNNARKNTRPPLHPLPLLNPRGLRRKSKRNRRSTCYLAERYMLGD